MNPHKQNCKIVLNNFQESLIVSPSEKSYILTPFFTTFCEGALTSIDIRNFLEMGLKIIRFKMSYVTRADKLKMLDMIKDAVKWCCEKHEVSTWPITISVDIPNACIRTGFFKEEIVDLEIELHEDWIVEVTASPEHWNKCDSRRIYIDDPYTIKTVPVGTEINIRFGHIVMFVIKVVDDRTLKCKVVRGGKIRSLEFVCFRDVKYKKPPLSKLDLELIKFAKDFKMDIITLNSLRKPQTLRSIKKLFSDTQPPLFISTICEQEGLDNLDEIIKVSDGIILAREFLASSIKDPQKMITIQMYVSGKCKQERVPYFISGSILERTLKTGTISGCDIDDVTNAVLQGAGFVMRNFENPTHVVHAIKHLNEICKTVEPLSSELNDFWRTSDEYRVPVNASVASILACALLAKMSKAAVIIVLTVTGVTAIGVSQMAPEAIILAVSTKPVVARRLQIHRGVVPLVYDEPSQLNWFDEMEGRIVFAVNYALKYDLLTYGARYVVFKKSLPTDAFADNISTWTVVTEENIRNRLHCYY